MTSATQNIFNALFEFHPRGERTPAENFLTEAFAYILGSFEIVRLEWLSSVIGKEVSKVDYLRTRFPEEDDDGKFAIPDMKISGELAGGQKFVLYSEHKWNSPCDSRQLNKYIQNFKTDTAAEFTKVIFIGASRRQVEQAEECHPSMKGCTFLWSDVFNALEKVQRKEPTLLEFLEFMKSQRLSPGHPITTDAMMGHIHSEGFVSNLNELAHTLKNDFDWSFVPGRYRNSKELPEVKDELGRVVLKFSTPDWKPGLIVGFLYNTGDLKVKFVDRKRGIDLFLRIETHPKNQGGIERVLPELKKKKGKLLKHADNVLLPRDDANGNRHTILIVRSCLGKVIQGKQERHAQLEAIHTTIRRWLEILFKDGVLEEKFKESGLNSGYKQSGGVLKR